MGNALRPLAMWLLGYASQILGTPSRQPKYSPDQTVFSPRWNVSRGYKFANTVGIFGVGAALHSYAPVVEEAWFDAHPRQPSGKNPNHGSDRNGGYGAKLVR
jgi:hypothetical protein